MLGDKCSSFCHDFSRTEELCTILEDVSNAVKGVEKNRIFSKEGDGDNIGLLPQEAEQIISQVSAKLDSLDTSKLENDFKEIYSLLEGIILLCSGDEDIHAKARLSILHFQSMELSVNAKETPNAPGYQR